MPRIPLLPLAGIFLIACPILAAALSPLDQLRSDDLRVAQVAYRLVTANAPLCERPAYAIGATIQTLDQYDPRDRAAAVSFFSLGSVPSILSVVPGSPADTAGLRRDDRIVALDGVGLRADHPAAKASYSWQSRTLAALETALANDGRAMVDIERAGVVQHIPVTGIAACASNFALVASESPNAAANGQDITISTALLAFVSSDDELAAVMAHELAHNILHHRERLDATGVSRGLLRILPANAAKIRRTEAEADWLSLYLVANAGYDYHSAAHFWRRYGERFGQGIFADGTHPSERSRSATLDMEAITIDSLIRSGLPLRPCPPLCDRSGGREGAVVDTTGQHRE